MPSRLLFATSLIAASAPTLQAQYKRSSYFFFQVSPNIQQGLQTNEHPQKIMREMPGRGLTFDIGYSRKIYRNWSLEIAIGGNLYNYMYTIPKMRLNMANRPGCTDYVLDDYFPFASGMYIAPTYQFNLGNTGSWKVGAGLKLVDPPAIRIGTSADYYLNGTTESPYGTLSSRIRFKGEIQPAITAFIQKQLVSKWRRLEAGILVNIYPRSMATGTIMVQTRDKSSNGTTDFYGSSIGINFRYSLN